MSDLIDLMAPRKPQKGRKPKYSIRVRRLDREGQPVVEVIGRPGWLLEKLIEHGSEGLTTAQLPPGVRVSHFVWLLRKDYDIEVQTKEERHAGIFAGRHGRYVLRSSLQLVREPEARAA